MEMSGMRTMLGLGGAEGDDMHPAESRAEDKTKSEAGEMHPKMKMLHEFVSALGLKPEHLDMESVGTALHAFHEACAEEMHGKD